MDKRRLEVLEQKAGTSFSVGRDSPFWLSTTKTVSPQLPLQLRVREVDKNLP